MFQPGELVKGKYNSYRIGTILGQGNFTAFYRGTIVPGTTEVFIKEYTDPTPLLKAEWEAFLKHQQEVLSRLRSLAYEGFEQCLDDFVFKNRYFQVKGLIKGSPLDSRLGGLSSLKEALVLLAGAARCLAVLHRIGMVHNDLKPAQFMLLDGHPVETGLRLTDFDFSLIWKEKIRPYKQATTPFYFAPEALAGLGSITPAADIFCLGLILFELFFPDKSPFAAAAEEYPRALHAMRAPQGLAGGRFPDPEALAQVYLAMLDMDPEKRPDAPTVFAAAVKLGGLALELPPQATATHFPKQKFCAHCGKPVPFTVDVKFCKSCGKPLATFTDREGCKTCGEPLEPEWAFCKRCGAKAGMK